MTLNFSTKYPEEMGDLAGQPTFFVEKIWNGLIDEEISIPDEFIDFDFELREDYEILFDTSMKLNIASKIHTIREDTNDRWKVGDKIHFTINNHTKDRFQFAPVLEVKSIQKIKIQYISLREKKHHACVYIDDLYRGSYHFNEMIFKTQNFNLNGYRIPKLDINTLAQNDGFDSVEDFFKWFDKDFNGKIISWTDLKY